MVSFLLSSKKTSMIRNRFYKDYAKFSLKKIED